MLPKGDNRQKHSLGQKDFYHFQKLSFSFSLSQCFSIKRVKYRLPTLYAAVTSEGHFLDPDLGNGDIGEPWGRLSRWLHVQLVPEVLQVELHPASHRGDQAPD